MPNIAAAPSQETDWEVTVKFPFSQLPILASGLGVLPYSKVAPLINSISEQVAIQQAEKEQVEREAHAAAQAAAKKIFEANLAKSSANQDDDGHPGVVG